VHRKLTLYPMLDPREERNQVDGIPYRFLFSDLNEFRFGAHPVKQPTLKGLSLQHNKNNQLFFLDYNGHLYSAAASKPLDVVGKNPAPPTLLLHTDHEWTSLQTIK